MTAAETYQELLAARYAHATAARNLGTASYALAAAEAAFTAAEAAAKAAAKLLLGEPTADRAETAAAASDTWLAYSDAGDELDVAVGRDYDARVAAAEAVTRLDAAHAAWLRVGDATRELLAATAAAHVSQEASHE